MKKLLLYASILFVMVGFQFCGKDNNKESDDNINTYQQEESNTFKASPNKAELSPIAESIVDAWMFKNLDNYYAYTPLIRSNKYEPQTDTYKHKCKYTYMNRDGGYIQTEKAFEIKIDYDEATAKINGYTIKEIEVNEY